MYIKGVWGIWALHFVLHGWATSAALKNTSHLCIIYSSTSLFFLMNLSVMTGLWFSTWGGNWKTGHREWRLGITVVRSLKIKVLIEVWKQIWWDSQFQIYHVTFDVALHAWEMHFSTALRIFQINLALHYKITEYEKDLLETHLCKWKSKKR